MPKNVVLQACTTMSHALYMRGHIHHAVRRRQIRATTANVLPKPTERDIDKAGGRGCCLQRSVERYVNAQRLFVLQTLFYMVVRAVVRW